MQIHDGAGALPLQYLFVPVDIPHMEVIHTVFLNLHRDASRMPAEVQPVAVGQAILAELRIHHTRNWSDAGSRAEVLDFCFEVHVNPDTWLIGGQRKARFSAKVHSL